MITTHDLRKQNPFDFKCKPDCPQCKEEKMKKPQPIIPISRRQRLN